MNANETQTQTEPQIVEKCLKLCKDYLSGNWSQQTVNSIDVREMIGDFNNRLFICSIKQFNVFEEVPQKVVIRFYEKNQFVLLEHSRLKDIVVAITFSTNNIGPQVYGIFDEGQILKFYEVKEIFHEINKI